MFSQVPFVPESTTAEFGDYLLKTAETSSLVTDLSSLTFSAPPEGAGAGGEGANPVPVPTPITRVAPQSLLDRMGKRVAAYIRVSSTKQARPGFGAAHISLEAQLAQIEKFCTDNDLELVKVFEDVGSARVSPNLLPGHKAMLRAANTVDTVIVSSVCRFSRNLAIGLDSLSKVTKKGAGVLSVSDLALYSGRTNPDKYTWYFGLTYAEKESDAISERVLKSRSYIESRGDDGIRRLVNNEDEQKVIISIIEKNSLGESDKMIAIALNTSGTLRRGKRWGHAAVRGVINRYNGARAAPY
jgi:DNA invertase Pin-like site-specific DNA recombinase